MDKFKKLSWEDKMLLLGGVTFGTVSALAFYRTRTNHQQMMAFLGVAARAIENGTFDRLDGLTDAAVDADKVIRGKK